MIMNLINKYLTEDRLNEGSYAIVHTNPEIEKTLSKAGFNIPKYPKQGKVMLNGKDVGRMDNFNGLMINSKSAIALIKKTLPKVGIWNENDAMNETAEMLIKFNRREKQKVLQALDSAGIIYSEMGDEEVIATFRNRDDAKKRIDKLPVDVRYTLY